MHEKCGYKYFLQHSVKSTIIYPAEIRCLKAKTIAKLNSTEMDFWRRSARITRKDKIRNTIIKTKNECSKVSFPCVVGRCHHGMARPQVADRGTAPDMEGSCEYIE